LHDAVTAERHKVPAVGVMTERFVSAAELMARVLGMPDYKFMVIPHPISSAVDEALRRMAEATATRLQAMLLRGPEQKLG
jgi:lactate dehydrogenase-like 2-hydroxyacid dehydrogenase